MENIKDLKLIIGPLDAEQWKKVTEWCDKTSICGYKFAKANISPTIFVRYTYHHTDQDNYYDSEYSSHERISYQQWYDRFIKKSKVLPERWAVKSTGKEMYEKYLEPFLIELNYCSTKWNGKDYYYNIDNKRVQAYSYILKGYTEISFEDFKELILEKDVKQNKEEIMSKKQNFSVAGSESLRKAFVEEVGYKTLSDRTISAEWEYLTISHASVFEGSNSRKSLHFILPQDWDKAVEACKEYFKEESKFKYKVGDWIYVTGYGVNDSQHPEYNQSATSSTIFQIDHFADSTQIGYKVAVSKKGYVVYIEQFPKDFRLATPEEIKSVQTKTLVLGDKKIKVEISKGEIWAGSKKLSIELVEEALNLMSLETALYNNNTGWAITFPSIKIGCTVLSLDEVKLIKKTYEELND